MTKLSLPLAVWCVLLFFACGGEPLTNEYQEVPLGGICNMENNCIMGSICYENMCLKVCRQPTDCPWGRGCHDAVCQSCYVESECRGGYSCDVSTGSCLTACRNRTDCQKGYFCAVNQECRIQQESGSACQEDQECLSGYCAAGICCESKCDGSCERCDLPQLAGICTPVGYGELTVTCNGQAVGCDRENGILLERRCDGAGMCLVFPRAESCGDYNCYADNDAAYCYTSCRQDEECRAPYKCVSGNCHKLLDNGVGCFKDLECQSGHCSSGVCCDSICSENGYSCKQPGFAGECRPL